MGEIHASNIRQEEARQPMVTCQRCGFLHVEALPCPQCGPGREAETDWPDTWFCTRHGKHYPKRTQCEACVKEAQREAAEMESEWRPGEQRAEMCVCNWDHLPYCQRHRKHWQGAESCPRCAEEGVPEPGPIDTEEPPARSMSATAIHEALPLLWQAALYCDEPGPVSDLLRNISDLWGLKFELERGR